MIRTLLRGTFLGFAFLVIPIACSDQTNSLPPQDPSLNSGFAPGVVTPVGPFPRGTVDPAVQLDQATVGPEIVVVTPVRGAQLTAQTINMRIKVTDPNGVTNVAINNIPATDMGNDEYEVQLTLNDTAVNFLTATAEDNLGNLGRGTWSLIHGRFMDINSFTDNLVGASLSNTGIDDVRTIVENLIAGLDLFPLFATANPLVDNFIAEINLTAVQNADVKLPTIEGQPNGLKIIAHIDDLIASVDTKAIAGLIKIPADLLSDKGVITVVAEVNQNPNISITNLKSALGLEIKSLDINLQNFRLDLGNGIVNAIVNLLKGVVRDIVEDLLKEELETQIDQLLGATALPGVGQPLRVDLPVPIVGTSSLDLAFRVSSAGGSANTGLGLALGAKITPAQQVLQGVSTSYFVTGVQAVPNVLMGDDFAVGLSSDVANSFLHSMWLAGGIRLRIDGTMPDPSIPLALNTRLLIPFFPQLSGLAPDPNTPIVIEVTTEAPPTARLGQSGASIEINAQEFAIKILIDYMDGQPPLEVLTLVTNLQLTADIALVNNEIRITNLSSPVVAADLTNEPVTDLADGELTNFIEAILPMMLDQFKNDIPAIPIPALPFGLDLQNPVLEIQPDFVVVRGNL
jgi:hypothetical protein